MPEQDFLRGNRTSGQVPLEDARWVVRESAPMPPVPPLRALRHRHLEMLRMVYGGAKYSAVAKVFGCNRWSVWRLVASPIAQEQLAAWHAESHRLTIDHPLDALIRYYGGRGQVRLAEGTPERQRQLAAISRARRARRQHRAAPQGDGSPKPSEAPDAVHSEPVMADPAQVAKVLRTIEAMHERELTPSAPGA